MPPVDAALGVKRGWVAGIRPDVATTGCGTPAGTFKDLGGERAATPLRQRGFYLDSKLVRGLESDRLTIGVTPNRREILWGGNKWMRSMELQFP